MYRIPPDILWAQSLRRMCQHQRKLIKSRKKPVHAQKSFGLLPEHLQQIAQNLYPIPKLDFRINVGPPPTMAPLPDAALL